MHQNATLASSTRAHCLQAGDSSSHASSTNAPPVYLLAVSRAHGLPVAGTWLESTWTFQRMTDIDQQFRGISEADECCSTPAKGTTRSAPAPGRVHRQTTLGTELSSSHSTVDHPAGQAET